MTASASSAPSATPVFEVRRDLVPGMLTDWFEVDVDELSDDNLFPDYDESGGVRDIVAKAVEHEVLVCSDERLEVTCYAVASDYAHLNLVAVRARDFRVHAQVATLLSETRNLVPAQTTGAADTVIGVLERVAAQANTVAPVAQRVVVDAAA